MNSSPVSRIYILALVVLLSVPVLLPTGQAALYRAPELYENGGVLINGSVVERYVKYNTSLEVVVRDMGGFFLDNIEVHIDVIDVDSGQPIISEILITSRKTIDYASATLHIEGGDLSVGTYKINLVSYVGGSPDATAVYFLDVLRGKSISIPYPKSIVFETDYLSIGNDAKTIIEFTEKMETVRCELDSRTYVFEPTSEKIWESTLSFRKDGERPFEFTYSSTEDVEADFETEIYVHGFEQIGAVPSITFRERYGRIIPIMCNGEGGNVSAYYTETTLHLFAGANYVDEMIIDLSELDTRSVERGYWPFKRMADEIQIIVSGLDGDVELTYVAPMNGRSVGAVFSDVRIRGVNDWRTLWGLLSSEELEVDFLRYDLYRIDSVIGKNAYDSIFLVPTNMHEMVFEYQ